MVMGRLKKALPSIASIGNHFLKAAQDSDVQSSSVVDSTDKSNIEVPLLEKAIPPAVCNQDFNDYYKSLKLKRWLYEKDTGIGSAKLTSVNYLNFLYSHKLLKPIEPTMIHNIMFEQSKCSFS